MVEFMRVSDVFGRLSFVNELGNMLIRNSFEVPHEALPSTVVANVKETLHYYENKRINDNINFSFIWISKL